MGSEALWVPIVMSLASAGVNEYSNRKTASKRDRDIAAGIRKTSETQEKANQRINQNVDELSKSTAQPHKDTLQGQFIDRINKVRKQALSGLNTEGGTSDAYRDAAGNAKVGAIDYGGAISSLLAGIDAAGNQRQAENKEFGNTGEDLLKFKRDADQDSFIAQLRASRHRNNPLLGILSAGLSGAAMGTAAGGFSGFGGSGPAASGVATGQVLPPVGAPAFVPPVTVPV